MVAVYTLFLRERRKERVKNEHVTWSKDGGKGSLLIKDGWIY